MTGMCRHWTTVYLRLKQTVRGLEKVTVGRGMWGKNAKAMDMSLMKQLQRSCYDDWPPAKYANLCGWLSMLMKDPGS